MSDTTDQDLARFLHADLRRAAEALEPLPDELVEAYVDEALDPVDREIVESALADDAALRARVDDLRALRAVLHRDAAAGPAGTAAVIPMAPARDRRLYGEAKKSPASDVRSSARRWTLPLGLAAAATLALLLIRPWTLLAPGPSLPPDGAAAGDSTPRPPLVASLRDGPGLVGVTADGTIVGVGAVDAGVRADVEAALRDGRLPAWGGAGAVVTRSGTLMAESGLARPPFTVQTPVATAVRSATPVFRWSALNGATRYRVRVVDTDLQPVVESPWVAARSWEPSRSLPRGRVLVWQVEAETAAGDVVIAPAPPQPESRFVILTEAEAAAVAQAAPSDLVTLVAATRAGLYDEAEAALARIAAGNAGSTLVRRLSESLARRRAAEETPP